MSKAGNDNSPNPVEDAMRYLTTGGLGEVYGMAYETARLRLPKVQMDTDMAIALCLLAQEALDRREDH